MANRIVQLALLLASITGQGPTRSVFNVSGVVQYPDGKPSPGASVIGKTSCNGEPYSLVQETITAADGTFHLQFVDAECNRIRLSASKRDEFWLRTGSDIFYTKENGTSPVIELSANGSPSDIVVQLGELGGLVTLECGTKQQSALFIPGCILNDCQSRARSLGRWISPPEGTDLRIPCCCQRASTYFQSPDSHVIAWNTLQLARLNNLSGSQLASGCRRFSLWMCDKLPRWPLTTIHAENFASL